MATSPSQTPTALTDLKVGDIIYIDVKINKADVADPTSKSTTMKKINKGDPVKRMCVVLVEGETEIEVTYLATFVGSTSLPARFPDKNMWYPIKPAKKEGKYEPLPPLPNGNAQWACLRVKQKITQDPVPKIDNERVSADSADSILQVMYA